VRANQPIQVMIVAGEVSGDLHGAEVVCAMRQSGLPIDFFGMGGAALAAAGVQLLVDAARVSVVGLTEVLTHVRPILAAHRVLKQALGNRRPDLVILIDFPDFNLRLARVAQSFHIPVLYYISPQIWAWRTGRIRTIRKRVDHMAVIFPFEARFFEANNVTATYVGHPLLDHPWPRPVKPDDGPFPVIGLLPGSRGQEVARHLPVMLDSIPLIRRDFTRARFLIAPADEKQRASAKDMVNERRLTDVCEIVSGGARSIFPRCHMVIAASGTVTLEAAIAGTPMVVIYRVSPVSYLLGRMMIRVNSISLVNLVAGKKVVPELIQKDALPATIAGQTVDMLKTPGRLDSIRRELADVKKKLGTGGAGRRVAEIAAAMINRRRVTEGMTK